MLSRYEEARGNAPAAIAALRRLTQMQEQDFDEARTRNPDGLGLGLHIARDVATRHGFELAFRRSEYGGLEVEFGGDLATSTDSTETVQ